jgi:hypothetical protein
VTPAVGMQSWRCRQTSGVSALHYLGNAPGCGLIMQGTIIRVSPFRRTARLGERLPCVALGPQLRPLGTCDRSPAGNLIAPRVARYRYLRIYRIRRLGDLLVSGGGTKWVRVLPRCRAGPELVDVVWLAWGRWSLLRSRCRAWWLVLSAWLLSRQAGIGILRSRC